MAETQEVEVFDYDAEFEKQAAKLEGREPEPEKPAEETEQDTQAPAEKPAPAAEAKKDEKKDEAEVQLLSDEELLKLIPEDQRAAAQARLEADRAEAKRLDNNNRALAGRMSAYQRRYEEAVGKRQPEPARQATAAETESWKTFEKDYPDIAAPIKEMYQKSLPTGVDATLKGLVDFVENEKRERFLQESFDAVEAVHPGWREVGSTPEFKQWLKSSPTYTKLASSDEVSDAIALFDLWNAAVSSQEPEAAQAAAASDTLAARRGAQLAGARAPKATAATPSENVDLKDEDQLFAFYAKQSDARLKGRYK